MLTDEQLGWIAEYRRDEEIGRMARELLALRKLARAELAATAAELAGRDAHDEWAAVQQAQTELDEVTR